VGRSAEEVYARSARADLAEALARLDACGGDAELLGLARRCLAPEPDDRPRDAGVVARELSAYLAGVQERLRRAELARVEGQVRAAQDRRARRLTVALAASVLAAVLIGVGGWARTRSEREAHRLRIAHAAGEAMALAHRRRGEARAAVDLALW